MADSTLQDLPLNPTPASTDLVYVVKDPAGVPSDTKATVGSLSQPGGSDTQVQFNDGGVFGGNTGLLFSKATKVLQIPDVGAEVAPRLQIGDSASFGQGGLVEIISVDGGDTLSNTLFVETNSTPTHYPGTVFLSSLINTGNGDSIDGIFTTIRANADAHGTTGV